MKPKVQSYRSGAAVALFLLGAFAVGMVGCGGGGNTTLTTGGTSGGSTTSGTTGGTIIGSTTGGTTVGINNGLVAYYTAEGNANDTVGTHSGVALGGATYDVGQVGQAFSLPGITYRQFDNGFGTTTGGTTSIFGGQRIITYSLNTASGIDVPDSPSLQLTGPLTLSAWVKVTALPPQELVFNPNYFGVSTTGGTNSSVNGIYQSSLLVENGRSIIVARGDQRVITDPATGFAIGKGLDPYKLYVDSEGNVAFHIESLTQTAEIKAPMPINKYILVTATLDSAGGMNLYENSSLVASTITNVKPAKALTLSTFSGQSGGLSIGNIFPPQQYFGTTTGGTTTGGTTATTTGGTIIGSTTGGTTIYGGGTPFLPGYGYGLGYGFGFVFGVLSPGDSTSGYGAAGVDQGNTYDEGLVGNIDEVRIYNVALGLNDVNALYLAGLSGSGSTTSGTSTTGGATTGGTTTTGGPPVAPVYRRK